MTKINYRIIDKCRVCNSEINDVVIDLKDQALTGVFVKDGTKVPKCDMTLGICSNNSCQLVQILQAYDLSLLYGDNYLTKIDIPQLDSVIEENFNINGRFRRSCCACIKFI